MDITETTPYFQVYPYISQSAEINSTEKLIYSYLHSYNLKGKPAFASNKHLAELFNLSYRGVQIALKSLESKGWISKIMTSEGRIICTNIGPKENL